MTNLASIDIGSHTARLLVSQTTGKPDLFRPLLRKRAYIHLAEGFSEGNEGAIRPEAIDRTLGVLGDFAVTVRQFNVGAIYAVCTGVVRTAINREQFLSLVHDHSGIKAELISGEEEAYLTLRGVSHSLGIRGVPFVIFDLGGGTTEIISGEKEDVEVKSVLLGAVTLKQRFLNSDPPEDKAIKDLSKFVDNVLSESLPNGPPPKNGFLMVGTGGTVTTLAAMIHGVDLRDIGPDRMNGLVLKREGIESLFERIRVMPVRERMRLPGLDPGRADVIIAGSVVVIRILHFFKSLQLVVSLSDLLEGVLISNLETSDPF